MKKIFNFLTVLTTAALLLSACAKENLAEVSQEEIPAGFTKMQISLSNEDVKTAVTDAGVVNWTNGDNIKFLYSGGSKKATIAVTDAASASVSAILPDSGDIYAVYPDGAGSLSGSTITVDISSKPTASFAAGNYAVAKLNRSTSVASFCNVTAFLKLDVSSVTGITRIQVESPSGAFLGGSYEVSFDGYTAQTSDCVDGYNTLYVDVPGPGVYYVPVVPGQTHSKGLSFLYLKKEGSDYTQLASYYYETALTTEKNRIYNFGAAVPVGGHYYVSVSGSGNKSGFNAENAMTFARFKDKVTAYSDTEENNRARINQTKTLAGATFHFAAGTYAFPSTTPLKIGSYQSADRLDITLQGVEGTIFDGNDTGSILQVNSQVNLTINDIAFANACATSTNAGGALYASNSASSITLNRCSFSDCTQAVDNGSGSALNVRYGTVTANDCTFSSNNAHAGGSINVNPNGGDSTPTAVFNNCTVEGSTRGCAIRVTNGTATFNGCTIQDNIHTNASNHGNLLCQEGAEVYVYGCTFSGNSAKEGGAIVCTSDSQVTVGDLGSTHTTFDGNTAANWNGGAIKAKGSGTISVTNAVFTSNKALNSSNSGCGGAVFIEGDVNLDLDGCSFTGNQSYGYGGALDIIGKGEVSVSDCVFDANSSTNQKGMSINVDGDEGANGATTADFTNCTVKNSNSAKGPAVQVYKATATFTGGSFENNVNTSNNNGTLRIVGGADVTVNGVDFYKNQAKSGGAIHIADASILTIGDNGSVHTTFRENNAASWSGGAINPKGAFTVNVTNAVFTSNVAKQSGGAIFDDEGSTGTMTFTGCVFDGNHSSADKGYTSSDKTGYAGGTISLNGNCTATLNDCEITGSYAKNWGSTIALMATRTTGTLTINGGNLHDNGTTSISGGVIFSTTEAPVVCNDVLFKANKADWGGVFATPDNCSPVITCTGCTFDSNYASDLGGVSYCQNASPSLTFTDCVFKGNNTKTDGGNVWKYYGGVWYSKTGSPKAVFNKCYFGSNYSNRGAVAHIDSGSATLYYNDCAMTGNYVNNRCGVVFSTAAGSELYLNNCSMSGSYSTYNSNNNNSSWIYNSGKLFLSNCTIAGDAKYKTSTKLASSGHISNNDTSGSIYMVNCIVAPVTDWCFSLHMVSTPASSEFYACKLYHYSEKSQSYLPDTSASTLNGADYTTSKFGSMTENKPASGSEAWDKYYWSWNGTMTGTNNTMATLANVNAKIQTLAPDFYTWLDGLGVLNKDGRGKTRGTSTWPGAYDGTNN